METSQKENGLFFIRVIVWARVRGNETPMAELIGGPWESGLEATEARARAVSGVGAAGGRVSQRPEWPNHIQRGAWPSWASERRAEVSVAWDMDLYDQPLDGGNRLAPFARRWAEGLEAEFQRPFEWASEGGPEETGATEETGAIWARLLARQEKERLSQAAPEPSARRGPARM